MGVPVTPVAEGFISWLAVLLGMLMVLPCSAQGPVFSPRPTDLKSLSLEELGNVEVTTQSKEPTEVWNTPAAIYILTQDDIRRSGVTNVPDARQSLRRHSPLKTTSKRPISTTLASL